MDHPPFSLPTEPYGPSESSAYVGLHPAAHPHNGGFNSEWGPEQQAFFNYVAQTTGGGSSTAGVPQTTNNDGNQYCKWRMPDGLPCNKGFANFNDLMDHLGRVHDVQGSASRGIVCQWLSHRGLCGQRYRRDTFRRHIGTHVGRSVRCRVCGKHFSRRDTLRAHLKKRHDKE